MAPPQVFQPFFEQSLVMPPIYDWLQQLCQPWDLDCFVTDVSALDDFQTPRKDNTRAALSIMPTLPIRSISFVDKIYVATDGS